jgi:hypothetical protein
MENIASDIPIYKIYHIRSPDVTKPNPVDEVEGGGVAVSELSPEYNVIYVFYGDVEFMADEGRIVDINDIFLQEPENPHFQRIFSDYELVLIRQYDIKVNFLPERIYPDDSIETVKKKFLYLTRDKVALSYAELYLFCKQAKHITTQQTYDEITSNGKLELTHVRLQNYLLNIDNHSKCADVEAAGAGKAPQYMKLGPPVDGRYTYTNIANLKLDDTKRIVNIALGQSLNIASAHEYPYAVNPFDALNADPFLEIHAGELVNTTNKMVLIDYGMFCDNVIYLVSAEDALVYARETEVRRQS